MIPGSGQANTARWNALTPEQRAVEQAYADRQAREFDRKVERSQRVGKWVGRGVKGVVAAGAGLGALSAAGVGAGTAGMAAPSYAPLASVAPTAAPAALAGTGFWGGVTAPTFGAAGTAAAPAVAAGTGGGMVAAAAPAISKGMLAFSAVTGFLRDFLSSKSSRGNEKARLEAERLLKEMEFAHEKALADQKILAEESNANPFRHSLDQIGAAELMDRIATIDPLQMTPNGRQIGRYSVPSFSGGAINYAASPELRAAAEAARAATLRGEGQAPSVVRGGPSGTGPNPRTGVMDLIAASNQGRPPVSTTMPVREPRLVGAGSLVDAPGPTVAPMDPNALRMSIEDLMAAPATARPMARRRRLPAAMPMR